MRVFPIGQGLVGALQLPRRQRVSYGNLVVIDFARELTGQHCRIILRTTRKRRKYQQIFTDTELFNHQRYWKRGGVSLKEKNPAEDHC
jgi:hypothetical protein